MKPEIITMTALAIRGITMATDTATIRHVLFLAVRNMAHITIIIPATSAIRPVQAILADIIPDTEDIAADHSKEEFHKRDSTPAAGRSDGILSFHCSVIPADMFIS